jgi:hypothetical protein
MGFGLRACLRVVAATVCIQNGFGQALAIPALSPARFGRCGAPAYALVRYQSVKIFDDLDAVSV